jgi:hypothetical protein
MTTENKIKVPTKFWIIAIVIGILVVGFFAFKIGQISNYNPNAVTISNVFADVNGDGKTDLIINANVVYNSTGDLQNLP